MRTTNLLVYLALALSTFAQTFAVGSLARAGGSIGGKPAGGESIEVGDVVWNGITFQHATARVLNADEIKLTPRDPGKPLAPIIIPWAKAPFDLKTKLAAAHDHALAAARAATPAPDPAEGQLISSEVIQVLPMGLVLWVAKGQKGLLRGHPREKKLAEGDVVKAIAKRTGVFKFTNTRGVGESVPAFDYISEYARPPRGE